jgi:Mg2+ and Co2+ transporter CorA
MWEKRQKLKELQQSLNEARTNETLHFLTMVTTLFLPVQVFSAIYGMNFQYMPEFGKKTEELMEDEADFMAHNGYYMFWLLVTLSTGILAFFMKCTGYL